MPEVDTAPLMNPLSQAMQAGAGRRLADKEAAAHRLRARGFSYRRIAETLRIRYDTVSRWLYGEAEATPPATPAPQPAETAPAVPLRAVVPPAAPLVEQRVAALEAALAQFQAEAAVREERLLGELTALRGMLEAAAREPEGVTRFLPWLRGRERG